jgi:DNA-nicking Smr family endonuclease
MRNIGTTAHPDLEDEEDAGGHRRSASSRMKQLKRGTIRISAELDLHGYLRDEAIQQLNRFITAAFTRGLSSVLVITGKGINSPDGPVLQGAVADWLRTAGKGMVAEFSPAPRDLGGNGAYVVFLKRQ